MVQERPNRKFTNLSQQLTVNRLDLDSELSVSESGTLTPIGLDMIFLAQGNSFSTDHLKSSNVSLNILWTYSIYHNMLVVVILDQRRRAVATNKVIKPFVSTLIEAFANYSPIENFGIQNAYFSQDDQFTIRKIPSLECSVTREGLGSISGFPNGIMLGEFHFSQT